MTKPMARRLAIDSLRYWAEEMGVDGFRFDLATVMGRGKEGDPANRDFDKNHPFYEALKNDPVLSKCKLIAEPWDCGAGGYQVGNFQKTGCSGTTVSVMIRAGSGAGMKVLPPKWRSV